MASRRKHDLEMDSQYDLIDGAKVGHLLRSVLSNAPEDDNVLPTTDTIQEYRDTEEMDPSPDFFETAKIKGLSLFHDVADMGCLPGSFGCIDDFGSAMTEPPASVAVMHANPFCNALTSYPGQRADGTFESVNMAGPFAALSQTGFFFLSPQEGGTTGVETYAVISDHQEYGHPSEYSSQSAFPAFANQIQLQQALQGQQQIDYHDSTLQISCTEYPILSCAPLQAANPITTHCNFLLTQHLLDAGDSQSFNLRPCHQSGRYDAIQPSSMSESAQILPPVMPHPGTFDSQQMAPNSFSPIRPDSTMFGSSTHNTNIRPPVNINFKGNEDGSGPADVPGLVDPLSSIPQASAPSLRPMSQLPIRPAIGFLPTISNQATLSQVAVPNPSKPQYTTAKIASKTLRKPTKKTASDRALEKHKTAYSDRMQKKTGVSTGKFSILTFGACTPFSPPERTKGKQKPARKGDTCWFCYLKHIPCSGHQDGDSSGCRNCRVLWNNDAIGSTSWKWTCDSRTSLLKLHEQHSPWNWDTLVRSQKARVHNVYDIWYTTSSALIFLEGELSLGSVVSSPMLDLRFTQSFRKWRTSLLFVSPQLEECEKGLDLFDPLISLVFLSMLETPNYRSLKRLQMPLTTLQFLEWMNYQRESAQYTCSEAWNFLQESLMTILKIYLSSYTNIVEGHEIDPDSDEDHLAFYLRESKIGCALLHPHHRNGKRRYDEGEMIEIEIETEILDQAPSKRPRHDHRHRTLAQEFLQLLVSDRIRMIVEEPEDQEECLQRELDTGPKDISDCLRELIYHGVPNGVLKLFGFRDGRSFEWEDHVYDEEWLYWYGEYGLFGEQPSGESSVDVQRKFPWPKLSEFRTMFWSMLKTAFQKIIDMQEGGYAAFSNEELRRGRIYWADALLRAIIHAAVFAFNNAPLDPFGQGLVEFEKTYEAAELWLTRETARIARSRKRIVGSSELLALVTAGEVEEKDSQDQGLE